MVKMDTIGKKLRKNTKGKAFLSDEIIISILSWVPAKTAMKCQLVCRRWRDFTLSRYFVDLHSRNIIPIILVANHSCYSRIDLSAVDRWWEPAGTRLRIHRFPFYSEQCRFKIRALFSHGGLIALQVGDTFFILNPVRPTREYVTITLFKKSWRSQIYGVYFHPSLNEYCSLWKIEDELNEYCSLWKTEDETKQIQYKVLILGSNPFLKTISNPFSNRVKMVGTNPLLINNYLYWMLQSEHEDKYSYLGDIMEFDIVKETFLVMPCPVPLDTDTGFHRTHLLNIDGTLSYILLSHNKITIWKLRDHAEQLWTAVNYTFNESIFASLVEAQACAIMDGNLALLSKRGLYVCNLTQGRMKVCQKRVYRYGVLFASHQTSLASLKNCKSTISIDEDGEVVVRD